jgi:hypothetical protein
MKGLHEVMIDHIEAHRKEADYHTNQAQRLIDKEKVTASNCDGAIDWHEQKAKYHIDQSIMALGALSMMTLGCKRK